MINPGRYSHLREDFIEAHGGMKAAIQLGEDDDVFLFPDGARIEAASMGQTYDPPEDRVKRLKLMLRYRVWKVGELEKKFGQLKKMIKATFIEGYAKESGYWGELFTGTEQEAEVALKKLTQSVKWWRNQVKLVKAKLDKLVKPPKRSREDEKIDRQIERQQEKFRNRINGYKI